MNLVQICSPDADFQVLVRQERPGITSCGRLHKSAAGLGEPLFLSVPPIVLIGIDGFLVIDIEIVENVVEKWDKDWSFWPD